MARPQKKAESKHQERGDRHRSTQETVDARRREVLRYMIRGLGTAQIHALLKSRYPDLTYRAVERDVKTCSERLREAVIEIDVTQEIAFMLAVYNELIHEAWKVYQTAEAPLTKAMILGRVGALLRGRTDLLARTGSLQPIQRQHEPAGTSWEENICRLRQARGLEGPTP